VHGVSAHGVHLQPRRQGDRQGRQAGEETLMSRDDWWLLAAIGLALWLANLPGTGVG
jgi:hypothetical protein